MSKQDFSGSDLQNKLYTDLSALKEKHELLTKERDQLAAQVTKEHERSAQLEAEIQKKTQLLET